MAGPVVKFRVPMVTLEHHSGKPVVDVPYERSDAHAAPLREVAELVRQHASELADGKARHQWQPDREYETALEHAETDRQEARRRVDLAVHLYQTRHRCAHLAANG